MGGPVPAGRNPQETVVDRAGFEPAYGKPGQIYSLLPLTTRPPVQRGHSLERGGSMAKLVGAVNAGCANFRPRIAFHA